MADMSGLDFFPVTNEEDMAPRYKSTAKARGFLVDPDSGTPVTGTTGTFTLWFEGTLIINARPMIVDIKLGTGWCSCVIAPTEITSYGLYQWQMVLKSPDNAWTLTDSGTFNV